MQGWNTFSQSLGYHDIELLYKQRPFACVEWSVRRPLCFGSDSHKSLICFLAFSSSTHTIWIGDTFYSTGMVKEMDSKLREQGKEQSLGMETRTDGLVRNSRNLPGWPVPKIFYFTFKQPYEGEEVVSADRSTSGWNYFHWLHEWFNPIIWFYFFIVLIPWRNGHCNSFFQIYWIWGDLSRNLLSND